MNIKLVFLSIFAGIMLLLIIVGVFSSLANRSVRPFFVYGVMLIVLVVLLFWGGG